ncbi:FtsX-like permease family protein [Nonomuraea sp. bgisy101]|uniref:FtsX-like permease family protein n=1 Tax=Nonomuraea sp. bgisy101 TaxID=3413784 RepID=UPI003D70A367
MTAIRLAARLTLLHRGIAALLGVLVLSMTLLGGALPRVFEDSYERSLLQAVRETRPELLEIAVDAQSVAVGARPADAAALATRMDALRKAMPPALASLVGEVKYGVSTNRLRLVGHVGREPRADNFVDLAWNTGAAKRVRYVKGVPPSNVTTGPNPLTERSTPNPRQDAALTVLMARPQLTTVEVGLPEDVTEQMGLDVGATIVSAGGLLIKVTGLYEPIDPADPFWSVFPSMARVYIPNPAANAASFVVTGLADQKVVAALSQVRERMNYRWGFSAVPSAFTVEAAPRLGAALDAFTAAARRMSTPVMPYKVTSRLPATTDDFLGKLGATQTLMGLQLAGLFAVAFGVVALVLGLLLGRVAAGLVAARARAASTAQFAAVGAAVILFAVVPGAALGFALSRLAPGLDTTMSLLAAPALVLATFLYGMGHLLVVHRGPLVERRDDLVVRPFTPRRLVADLLVVLLAAVAAYLAISRGVTAAPPGSGGDPLLVAAPTAVALACALVLLWGYPYLLRLLSLAAARSRRPVLFLAVAAAARSRTAATLPALILVPALTLSVYSALTLDSLAEGQRAAAWQRTGADARVSVGEGAISPEAIEQVRGLPGVREVIPFELRAGRLSGGTLAFTYLRLDTAAYARSLADAPPAVSVPVTAVNRAADRSAATAKGSAAPVLVTRGLGTARARPIVLSGNDAAPVVVDHVGHIERFPGVEPAGELLVLPTSVLPEEKAPLRPNELFVFGEGINAADLEKALGAWAVAGTREADLAAIVSTPLTRTITLAFRLSALALAVYSLLAVWVTVVAGAAERRRSISYLSTMGMSGRQAQAITLGEVSPLVITAGVAGILLGTAYPAVFGGGVDLSDYAGGLPVGYSVTWTTPLLLGAGVTVAALLGAVGHVAASGRRGVGVALRAGE